MFDEHVASDSTDDKEILCDSAEIEETITSYANKFKIETIDYEVNNITLLITSDKCSPLNLICSKCWCESFGKLNFLE